MGESVARLLANHAPPLPLLLIAVGAALISVGCWMIWPAAGVLAAGAQLLAFGLLGAVARGTR